MKPQNKKIRTFIIEDTEEERNILIDYFKNDNEISICGCAEDGLDGLEQIKRLNPDLILTDFIMPKIDGLTVMKEMKKFYGEEKPKVIFISATGNSKIIDSAFNEGADYYLKKPVELDKIKETMFSVFNKKVVNSTSLSNKIRELTMGIGAPVNVTGYKYIVTALLHMLSEKGKNSFLNEVYRDVAENCETTSECVEISIRNAIKKASLKNTEKYKTYFGNEKVKSPSNSLFLNTLKEIILMNE